MTGTRWRTPLVRELTPLFLWQAARRGHLHALGGRPPRAPWLNGAPAWDEPSPQDLSSPHPTDAPAGASEAIR